MYNGFNSLFPLINMDVGVMLVSPSKKPGSISSMKRLEDLLQETESELETLQPKIERLEKEIEKLKDLKRTKQKLITLKLSIKSIIENFSDADPGTDLTTALQEFTSPFADERYTSRTSSSRDSMPTGIEKWIPPGTFLPDRAFEEANTILRQKNSTNYEIFRAVVFNGGRASTEQIKDYLVENNIKQPTTGEGFEGVDLTDISSRTNYLVRKNILKANGKGSFIANVGWVTES